MDIHKFQECFKRERSEGLKGDAYKHCLSQSKDIERPQTGKVFKDGKPKHDLYNLEENVFVSNLIDMLLDQ